MLDSLNISLSFPLIKLKFQLSIFLIHMIVQYLANIVYFNLLLLFIQFIIFLEEDGAWGWGIDRQKLFVRFQTYFIGLCSCDASILLLSI